jgi:hypothetical protein
MMKDEKENVYSSFIIHPSSFDSKFGTCQKLRLFVRGHLVLMLGGGVFTRGDALNV